MAFNGLTDAEAELLDMLAEECAEVIVAVSKIKRHGFENFNPDDPEAGTNRDQLLSELIDVEAVKQMITARHMIEVHGQNAVVNASIKKLKYAHHLA